MPRAVDPSLIGQQLPVDHSPLNRIDYRNRKPDVNLDAIMDQLVTFVEDYLFPVIEDITGIDLSAFLPLLDLLDLDFSSPEAFLASLVNAIIALPAVLISLLTSLIEQLTHPDNSDTLNSLLTSLISLLISLPALLIQLAESLVSSGAGLLGVDSPLNLLNAFNLLPTDLLGQIPHSGIGETLTNLIADPFFLDADSFAGLDEWFHDLTGGFGGTGTAYTTADGSTKELLGNLIGVSQGQVMPITGKVKWTGLAGTGNPIALAVTGYSDAGAAIDQRAVASHNTTPPTTDWIDFAGQYTVPANVTSVRTRLVVGSGATAGTVSFSQMSATKTNSVFQRLIAGTDPGTTITNDIQGLFSGVTTNALAILQRAGLTDFNDLVSTLGGDVQEGFEDIGDRLDDFLHSLSPLNADNINTGSISDQFVPGLSTIHDAVVNAVGNLSGSGFDIGKVLEVLTGQTHSVVDSSASLVGMFNRLTQAEQKLAALPVSLGGTGVGLGFGGVTGLTDTDDFERVGPTPGALWVTSYSGGAGTVGTPNGHDLSFQTSGTSDRDYLMIRNNSAILRSATDYQRVTQVVSAKGSRFYDPLLGTYNYTGHNDVWLRVSDASTSLANVTGIRIRFGADGSLSIARFVNGAGVMLKAFGSGSITPPGPGATLIGEAGDMNGGTPGQRYFRGIIGSSQLIDVTETGTASGFGAANRRWGTGGRAEGHLLPLPGQEKPGSLVYWTGMDQQL